MIERCVCLLLFVLFLAGCTSSLLRPPREEWPEIGNEFAKALRWTEPEVAAAFVANGARPAFLEAYNDGDALQMINIRHDSSGPATETTAKGLLMIEYYRSPSVSVKKATVPLEWSCLEAGSLRPCRWEITTQMSRLP